MHIFFTADEFTPTKSSSAKDKAAFGNQLLHFMATGFKTVNFTGKLYDRLSMCFGHIAHCDREGFIQTWFTSPEGIAGFMDHLVKWPCWGDAEYTYSDVESAVQREVAKLNLCVTVHEALDADVLRRELALLDMLEKKYRPGTVIEMPHREPEHAFDDPCEQLPLIA